MTHVRALLAAVLVGGGLVLLGAAEPEDRLSAGLGMVVVASLLVGVDVIDVIRRRRRPPE